MGQLISLLASCWILHKQGCRLNHGSSTWTTRPSREPSPNEHVTAATRHPYHVPDPGCATPDPHPDTAEEPRLTRARRRRRMDMDTTPPEEKEMSPPPLSTSPVGFYRRRWGRSPTSKLGRTAHVARPEQCWGCPPPAVVPLKKQ